MKIYKTTFCGLRTIALSVLLMTMLFNAGGLKAQWTKFSSGIPTNEDVYSLTYNGSTIFAATNDTGLFRSTNSGVNWTYVNGVPSNYLLWSVYCTGSNVFVGTQGDGIYRSTNNGVNWTQVNAGLTNFNPRGFITKGQYILASFWGGGVYRSSNNGIDWFPTSLTNSNVWHPTVMGSNIFVSRYGNGISMSTNDGANWVSANGDIPNFNSYELEVVGNTLYLATASGVYKSSNSGTNWVLANQGITGQVTSLLSKSGNLIAGTSAGVYRSTNGGSTWTVFNTGLTTAYVLTMIEDNTYLYVGTYGGSIFRRPLSEIILGVTNISTVVPDAFSLSQNYPNPFNPVTNIEFKIAKAGYVTMKVFDSQGREVSTLVKDNLKAGTYNVDFSSSGLSSGVYYYRLESENFEQTKSMVLLK